MSDSFKEKIIQDRKERIKQLYEERAKYRQQMLGKEPKKQLIQEDPPSIAQKTKEVTTGPDKEIQVYIPREKEPHRYLKYSETRNRWKDETVCVIASGPSLTKEDCEEVDRRGWKTIAINDTYKMAPFADVMYACDGTWWNVYHEQVKQNYTGEMWTQDKMAAQKYEINFVQSVNRGGLGTGEMIHQGANSGYQCVNLAYFWGAKRIILLGLDCSPSPEGKKHWFGDHPKGLSNSQPFERWRLNFKKLSEDLNLLKIEVINASRRTALDCFKKETLENIY